MNARSIGIEHEGRQNAANPWQPTEAQLNATAELVAGICQRHGIPADRAHLIGHSEVFPGRAARANCPGRGWPWDRFLALVSQHMLVKPEVPAPAKIPASATPEPGKRTVRIMDAATNKPICTGTLIDGTDKVYLTPDTLKAIRDQ